VLAEACDKLAAASLRSNNLGEGVYLGTDCEPVMAIDPDGKHYYL